jgi:hypothetical protein
MKISEPAKICLSKLKEDKTKYIIDYKEILDHDGYDEYGPESNLWDFFILYTSGGEDFVEWYHLEDWFLKDTSKEYTLNVTLNMNIIRNIEESLRKTLENKVVKMFGYYT